ncbi:MAG: sensor histidine kinase [Chitinophagaceae bacterium]|nr:MAG: sensor histidine kinase [Chitinophagaceae bacterium]
MIPAPIPADDLLRLHDLHELGILDTPEEEEFNEIVQLASKICHTPISLISLVDYSRQWFKAKVGVEAAETPRDISFCGHAIVMDSPFFEVVDALKDKRFFDNPLVVKTPNIRYYAGVQLVTKNGSRIGMLCVNDTKPNKLTDEQVFALKVLGNHVAKLLDLRITKKQLEAKTAQIENQNQVLTKMISIIAHDVRGPIGSLKSFFELADQKLLDEETREQMMKMSEKQVDVTLSLLNNLVDWATMTVSDKTQDLKRTNVKEVVDAEIALLLQTAEFKGNLLVNLVSDTMELRIDRNVLGFIFRNLITNANKFTTNGKIIVYSDFNKQYDTLIINDTGVGMTQTAIDKLLSTDAVVTTPGTNQEKGSGLGFRLVKEFMQKNGGRLELKSEVGKGTSVLLLFPKK